jgi:hypothetical protein
MTKGLEENTKPTDHVIATEFLYLFPKKPEIEWLVVD